MDETITTPRPKRRVEAISDLPSRLGAPCVGGAHGRWTIQQGDVQSMAASGPSVWTGRALQAESDDLEVMGLALLYPALDGTFEFLAIMDIRARSISFASRPRRP